MTFHETRAKGASDEMRELVNGIKDEVALIKDDIYEIRTQQASQGGKIEILSELIRR
jgi:hypothetical protein